MKDLSILTEYSGHTYYGSPYETCSNCGNCTGAMCDYCEKVYTVIDWTTGETILQTFNLDEAKRVCNR